MLTELLALSAREQARLIATRQVSCEELARLYRERHERHNDRVVAFVDYLPLISSREARAKDEATRRLRGPPPPCRTVTSTASSRPTVCTPARTRASIRSASATSARSPAPSTTPPAWSTRSSAVATGSPAPPPARPASCACASPPAPASTA